MACGGWGVIPLERVNAINQLFEEVDAARRFRAGGATSAAEAQRAAWGAK